MYDMYPWDSRADGPRTRPPAPRDDNHPAAPDPAAPDQAVPDPATQAVQVALDRRDNGGHATQPLAATASRVRQSGRVRQ